MNKGYAMGFISSEIKPQDLELKNGETLKKLRFSIACKRTKETDFPSFVAFGKTAENIARFFEKGKGIFIEYHVQTGSFLKDGKKVYTQDLLVDNFEFPPIRKTDEPAKNGGGSSFAEMANESDKSKYEEPEPDYVDIPDNIEDDLPFR